MAAGKEELSSRLQTVASLIPESKVIVDVGSDHGKLGAWCLLSGRCQSLIATDIHEAPAKRTADYLRLCGLAEKSSVLCTDGLSGVEINENTTVVIAGMGGLEIRKILSEYLEQHNGVPSGITFVLQPQRSFYELRTFLSENCLSIREEAIALERGHFYVVLKVEPENEEVHLSDAELLLGPYILKQKPTHFEEYMDHQHKLLEKQALGDSRCAAVLDQWEDLL
ncbi:MAG: SAM-dependent methyltransferase [Clostridiales bacterium]|nr:SAM-dependent methyltransferase [Clostridiales bacterium]